MQVQGWVWYQGESNVANMHGTWKQGETCGLGCKATDQVCRANATACADFYACQFPAMITDVSYHKLSLESFLTFNNTNNPNNPTWIRSNVYE